MLIILYTCTIIPFRDPKMSRQTNRGLTGPTNITLLRKPQLLYNINKNWSPVSVLSLTIQISCSRVALSLWSVYHWTLLFNSLLLLLLLLNVPFSDKLYCVIAPGPAHSDPKPYNQVLIYHFYNFYKLYVLFFFFIQKLLNQFIYVSFLLLSQKLVMLSMSPLIQVHSIKLELNIVETIFEKLCLKGIVLWQKNKNVKIYLYILSYAFFKIQKHAYKKLAN